MAREFCEKCEKPATSFHLLSHEGESLWVCRHCLDGISGSSCRLFEYGHENPLDPKGSTAHVREIKDRRWHPTEKRLFHKSKELPGRSYFFPKG